MFDMKNAAFNVKDILVMARKYWNYLFILIDSLSHMETDLSVMLDKLGQ